MALVQDAERTDHKPTLTRTGVSLDEETRQIADELARRYHGENVSRLVRHLLQDAWQREQAEKEPVAA